jgi:hypothetical protein
MFGAALLKMSNRVGPISPAFTVTVETLAAPSYFPPATFLAAAACCFFWDAALVLSCFCAAFLWADFGDLSLINTLPSVTGLLPGVDSFAGTVAPYAASIRMASVKCRTVSFAWLLYDQSGASRLAGACDEHEQTGLDRRESPTIADICKTLRISRPTLYLHVALE